MRTIGMILLLLPLQLAFSPDSEILRQQLQQREEENRKAFVQARKAKARQNQEDRERAMRAIQRQEQVENEEVDPIVRKKDR